MRILKLLYVQVLIGIAAGVFVGWAFPGFAPIAKIISETFINMIRMVIAPIIFFTLVLGIAGAGDLKRVGRIGGKGIIYFEIVTTLALIIGLIVSHVVQPGAGIPQTAENLAQAKKLAADGGSMNWAEFFSHIVPPNVVDAFAKGDMLQVLFFSVLFGIALSRLGKHGQSLLVTFEKINKVLFNIMHMVMHLAPIGAFGGMAYTIGKFGFASLAVLGKLMLTFYITVFLFICVVLFLVARLFGFNLFKLLAYIKEEILICLGSSSSETVLPNLMEKLEQAGVSRRVVSLIVPAGYSFNLDGTTIYLSMCVLFLAQVYHIDLSIWQQLTIIGVLMLTSKGAAGVTGSGFIVLASTLAALKVIPLEGLALLIGVDRFMSEARSVTNFIGNAVATVVVARSEKAVDMARWKLVVEERKTAQPGEIEPSKQNE